MTLTTTASQTSKMRNMAVNNPTLAAVTPQTIISLAQIFPSPLTSVIVNSFAFSRMSRMPPKAMSYRTSAGLLEVV